MSTAARTSQPAGIRRALLVLAILGAVLLVAVGGYTVGTSLQPDAADALAEREVAAEEAYPAARADAFSSAYERSWQPAFDTGAELGERDGADAGARAARR